MILSLNFLVTEHVKMNDKKFKAFDFLRDNLKIVCSVLARSLQIYDNLGKLFLKFNFFDMFVPDTL